jgi:hypothetical protein
LLLRRINVEISLKDFTNLLNLKRQTKQPKKRKKESILGSNLGKCYLMFFLFVVMHISAIIIVYTTLAFIKNGTVLELPIAVSYD